MTNNQIRYQEHLERQRSNRKSEQLTANRDRITADHYFRSDAEDYRSNLARELENNRHNIADEQLRAYQAQMGVSQREREIELASSRLAADIEHNAAVRSETERSHLAQELETSTANRKRESQLAKDLAQRYAAMMVSSADRALPGLGTIIGAITSFASMGSVTKQKQKQLVDASELISRKQIVGG